jgi:hypothetical protein
MRLGLSAARRDCALLLEGPQLCKLVAGGVVEHLAVARDAGSARARRRGRGPGGRPEARLVRAREQPRAGVLHLWHSVRGQRVAAVLHEARLVFGWV